MTDQKLEKMYISLRHGQGLFFPIAKVRYKKDSISILPENSRKGQLQDSQREVPGYSYENSGKDSLYLRDSTPPISVNIPSLSTHYPHDSSLEEAIDLEEYLRENYQDGNIYACETTIAGQNLADNRKFCTDIKGTVTIFDTYDTKPLVLDKTICDFIARKEDSDEFVIIEQ